MRKEGAIGIKFGKFLMEENNTAGIVMGKVCFGGKVLVYRYLDGASVVRYSIIAKDKGNDGSFGKKIDVNHFRYVISRIKEMCRAGRFGEAAKAFEYLAEQ